MTLPTACPKCGAPLDRVSRIGGGTEARCDACRLTIGQFEEPLEATLARQTQSILAASRTAEGARREASRADQKANQANHVVKEHEQRLDSHNRMLVQGTKDRQALTERLNDLEERLLQCEGMSSTVTDLVEATEGLDVMVRRMERTVHGRQERLQAPHFPGIRIPVETTPGRALQTVVLGNTTWREQPNGLFTNGKHQIDLKGFAAAVTAGQ